LLSAFVEAVPEPRPPDTAETEFLPLHVLPPRIEGDEYLRFTFEQRLELELESAGIGRAVGECGRPAGVFASEIEHFMAELEEARPAIERSRAEVLEKLPDWQADEQRRTVEQKEFVNLLRDFKRKSHRK
jgi:hypothetical protein